ncbi:MAG: DsbA family protein [Chakrabartia sp.]
MIRYLASFLLALCVWAAPAAAAPPNYTKMVTITPQGAFVLGNPRAKVRLVEYLSYTCSHCAHFTEDASGPLKANYIAKGLVAYEMRHLVRDQLDLTAALLARCGGPSRVFQLTEDMMGRQPVWMADAQVIAIKQEAQLKSMPLVRQLQTFAKGSGLSAIAQARGVAPGQINACLASDQMQKTLLAMTKDAVDVRKLVGTPSFFINDAPGPKSSKWEDIEAALIAALSQR